MIAINAVQRAYGEAKKNFWLCRLHLNALGYDLENEFFIDLATPRKWVNSTVCDCALDLFTGTLGIVTFFAN